MLPCSSFSVTIVQLPIQIFSTVLACLPVCMLNVCVAMVEKVMIEADFWDTSSLSISWTNFFSVPALDVYISPSE